jgi:hypothetical protein
MAPLVNAESVSTIGRLCACDATEHNGTISAGSFVLLRFGV